MPITSCKPDVAKTINKLRKLLERDFGPDYSYSINGRGMVIAQHNINGVKHPFPYSVSDTEDALVEAAEMANHEGIRAISTGQKKRWAAIQAKKKLT